MKTFCAKCAAYYDDEFRTTICPHETFAANNGKNQFEHHPDALLVSPPSVMELHNGEAVFIGGTVRRSHPYSAPARQRSVAIPLLLFFNAAIWIFALILYWSGK